ncbi:MAG: tyrosine-type recombinase/integrase [Candidatus Njordarchaeum guaymaensis]
MNSMLEIKLDDIPNWSQVNKLCKELYRLYLKKRTLRSLRNYLLISLLAKTGVRLGELLGIKKEDVNIKSKTIIINQLKKRRKAVREIVIPPSLIPELSTYVRHIRGEKLFKMSERNARRIIYYYTEKILGRRFRPHAFRHTYALRILEKTKNLELVRRILGHSRYDVLKAYLNYTVRDKKEEIIAAIESEV